MINLEKKENKIKIFYENKPFKPFPIREIPDNPIPTPNIDIQILKSKKHHLERLYTFIDWKKHDRLSVETSNQVVMPISVLNKRLQSICGSARNVTNFLDYCIEIGLLSHYDEHYQYNHYKTNFCKRYIYHTDNEIKLRELLKSWGIGYKKEKNAPNKNKKTKIKRQPKRIGHLHYGQVKFNSKLNLQKPNNMTKSEFEEWILSSLDKNYNLNFWQSQIDDYNNLYNQDNPNLNYRFKPNITWNIKNTVVKKIGIRNTTSLCNAKNEYVDDKNYHIYKKDVLKELNLSHSYDVTSSIPRVNILLEKGYWLDEKTDIYKEINEHRQKSLNQKPHWDNIQRDYIKSMYMSCYFDGDNVAPVHIEYRECGKQPHNWNKDRYEKTKTQTRAYKHALKQVIGKSYDSEIFFHESIIYFLVIKKLSEQGIKVWGNYDCFYTDKEVDNIQNIIKDCAEEYYNNYFNQNKKEEITMGKRKGKQRREFNSYVKSLYQNGYDNNLPPNQEMITLGDIIRFYEYYNELYQDKIKPQEYQLC